MLNKIFKKKIHVYKAKDLMTKHVITLQPQENLLKAQRMMSRYRIKKIVVVDDDVDYSHKNKKHPVGILTIKDILKFLISDKTDRDVHEISISEAMSKNLITINKDNSIIDCSKALYNDNKISSLIVVEEDDEYEDTKGQEQQKLPSVSKKILLSGIITSTDFTAFFSENCTGLASVKDYMSHPVFTISINEKLLRAAELMIEKNVSQLVVTTTAANGDQESSLLGVLSESDISRVTLALKSKTLRSVYENIQVIFASSKRNKLDDSIEPSLIRIQDIFTPNPTTIEQDTDLARAAKIMIKQGINGIPVTETSSSSTTTEGQEEEKGGKKMMIIKNQQPLGIISKTDIVKALAKLE
jgi:CBS domain-containing protein